jgi:hypothetical protein
MQPTVSDVHIPTTDRGKRTPISKPWTVANVPPSVANFTEAEKVRFIEVANRVLEETDDEGAAIRAGLGAVNQMREKVTKANHAKNLCMLCKEKPPELDVLWNGGHSRAWFCDSCFHKWSLDKGGEIVGTNRISEGVVPGRYKIKNSPKGVTKMDANKRLTINGVQTTLGEMAKAWLEKKSADTSVIKDFQLLEALSTEPNERIGKPAEPEPDEGEQVAKNEKTWDCEIVKADSEKRIVYGIVLQPDIPDSQRDVVGRSEIEKAAHGFMYQYGKSGRKLDFQHQEDLPIDKAYPVESYITPTSFSINGKQIPEGAWIMGVHVPDDKTWTLIKSEQLKAFSVKGVGRRTPVG